MASIDVYINADTYISKSAPDANYGGDDPMIMRRYYSSGYRVWYALVWVTGGLVNAVPGTITAAELHVYGYQEDNGTPADTLKLRRPNNAWTEMTATYNTVNGDAFTGTSDVSAQTMGIGAGAAGWVVVPFITGQDIATNFDVYGNYITFNDHTQYKYGYLDTRDGANPPFVRCTYTPAATSKQIFFKTI